MALRLLRKLWQHLFLRSKLSWQNNTNFAPTALLFPLFTCRIPQYVQLNKQIRWLCLTAQCYLPFIVPSTNFINSNLISPHQWELSRQKSGLYEEPELQWFICNTPLLFPSADFPAFTLQGFVLKSVLECKTHFTSEGWFYFSPNPSFIYPLNSTRAPSGEETTGLNYT